MRRKTLFLWGVIAAATGLALPVQAADPLSLDDAVRIARDAADPTVTRHAERAAALDDRAVADSQLPDPNVKLGLRNLPVDDLDPTREPMTQVEIGLQQAFPAGNTRSLTRRQRQAQADAARAGGRLAERDLVLQTRLAWLEAYHWSAALRTLRKNREAVSELADVTTATFASGRQSSQDVLRAELELALIDDRLAEAEGELDIARAALARYISGTNAARPLPDTMPPLRQPADIETLKAQLTRHPTVAVNDARVAAETSAVAIAEEKYQPQWMLDVGYGMRGGGRSDFASAGVTLSVPFFTGKRQDRQLSAARHDRQAERLERDAKLRDLYRTLTTTHAEWRKLGERMKLYEEAVLERASGTTEAALSAYRNGVADFDDLISGRLSELDAELTLLRLRVDRAKAQARLLFLDGDDHE